MATSEAQQRATKKYQAKLERIYIWLAPEQKELITSHVEKTGESVNAFVQRAIAEAMERDNNKNTQIEQL